MGRVYAVNPDPAGSERSGRGYRFFTHTGEKLPPAFRVEFDADADCGVATVAGYACTLSGTPLVDYLAGRACEVAYRTWVRAVPPGEPDPPRDPKAVLWRAADGSLAVNADPVPSVPFTTPAPAEEPAHVG